VVEEPAPKSEAEAAEEPATKVEAPKPAPGPKPEPAAAPAAEEKVEAPEGADPETFERVLNEQLEKGLARPIAVSRARAAAIKAAREKADAG
jgi:hypothetical protein